MYNIKEVYYNNIKYIVTNPGEIMIMDGIIYDQLDKNLPIIPRKIIGHYIRKKYNLSQKEYYNIIVFGDGNYKKVCSHPECNNEVNFRGLTKGFYDNTCCKSHAQSLSALNGTHHFIKEFGSMSNSAKKITRERVLNGTHQFQDYKNRAKNHRSVFINKGSISDICVFYITELLESPDLIKIGITSDIDYRRYMNNISGSKYINTEVIVTSTRVNIADLEMNIKIDMHNLSIMGLEYFKKSDKSKIIDYINSNFKFND